MTFPSQSIDYYVICTTKRPTPATIDQTSTNQQIQIVVNLVFRIRRYLKIW